MSRLRNKSIVLFFSVCFLILSVSFLTFAEVEKDLLDMTLEELMNVKITTAARTPEKIGDIPASVVLITREDIEAYGYQTLTEILENIPGLYNIDDYSGGANFGVRGYWSGVPNDNMIILVNGVSQVDDVHSNYPLPKISVPVEAIERIEVIRGPMSVIYGNGAFFGVINIFTNDFPRDESTKGAKNDPMSVVSASYGSEITKKFFIRAAGHKDDFDYVFNASLYDTYGMDHPISKMVRDPSVLQAYYGVLPDQRTGGRLENNEKYFNFSGYFKGLSLDISYIETQNEFYYLMPSYSNGNISVNNTINISFGYKKKLSDIIAFDGKFGYFQSRIGEEYDFLFEDFYGIQQLESEAWEIDFNSFINVSPVLNIKTGLYFREVLYANNMYDLPSFGTSTLENNYLYLSGNKNIVTRAFFTQVNYRPFSDLTIVCGIRLEQMPEYALGAVLAGGTKDFMKVENVYNQDEVEIIPRFAAIYSLSDNHIFKLLYGQAINRPSFFQNTLNLLLEKEERDSLKPESIRTLELNYIASFSRNFTLNISIFRNTLENLITRVGEIKEEEGYVTWSANAGKMVTHGAELTLNVEPIENFRIELSGTYQETEDKRPGYENIEVAYSPKTLGYMKASYRTKGFTLALTGNYVGAMETFWDESIVNQDGSMGNRIGDRVDGYFLLGANLRIENIFAKGLYLNIRCSNLLNEEIYYPTFTNNVWATIGTLGRGRTILIGIGLKF